LGNHDYGDYSKWPNKEEKRKNKQGIIDFFQTIGFNLLLNSSVIVDENGEKLGIVGVENWGNPPFKQYGNLQKALKGLNGIGFKILLSHDPSHWAEEIKVQTDIALTLSGHTHGMQAGIQYKGFTWSPIKYKYQHWGGLYGENDQFLYVNRGLGWMGFPGRLGMRPEITLIELFDSR
ncbi:MAG: metallophosphoesterase, partial [Flavobacteriaceae bacterium]|nr:metallophosphoesterase [Flavobacteriaceae bacterium]